MNEDFQTMDDMMNLGQLNGVNDPLDPASFMQQLQGMQTNTGISGNAGGSLFADEALDLTDISAKNRNRGNYRCSKCGVPKKGHVCPLIPTNFKCARCGLSKKACTCVAPATRSIGIQVEMDEDMTTRALDLDMQGVMLESHKLALGFPSSAMPNA